MEYEGLFSIVKRKDIHKGDILEITYCFGSKMNEKTNKILIIDEDMHAVWYEEGIYSGKNYLILPYQIILRKIKTINVEEYLEQYKEDYFGGKENEQ